LLVIPFAAEQRVAIGRVSVKPALRRQGLARELMGSALARCALDYAGWPITVSAQLYLAAFYEQLGFRRVSEPYDDCGVPHVDMAMAMPSAA
jgi:ElaA protein